MIREGRREQTSNMSERKGVKEGNCLKEQKKKQGEGDGKGNDEG